MHHGYVVSGDLMTVIGVDFYVVNYSSFRKKTVNLILRGLARTIFL